MDKYKNIDIVYTHFPHYRLPVFSALSKSNSYKFKFFFDKKLNMSGIKQGLASGEIDCCDIKNISIHENYVSAICNLS